MAFPRIVPVGAANGARWYSHNHTLTQHTHRVPNINTEQEEKMSSNNKQRAVITITQKAHDVLKRMVRERESTGGAATVLSMASEIIIKAGDDAKNQHVLG